MIQLLRGYSSINRGLTIKQTIRANIKTPYFGDIGYFRSKERHLRFVAHPLFCSHNWLGAWKSLINATNIVILTDGAFLKANIILKTHALYNETRTFWQKIYSYFWKDFINHEVIKKIVHENTNSFHWYFNAQQVFPRLTYRISVKGL